MEDQRTKVEKLLAEMNLVNKWHLVEPVPGDLKGRVWLQNSAKSLDAYVDLSPADLDNLDIERLKNRIRKAISNAKERR